MVGSIVDAAHCAYSRVFEAEHPMGDFSTIEYSLQDEVATIHLNRPAKLNAINLQMVSELEDATRHAEADPGVKVIILAGRGKSFSAGFDLKEIEPGSSDPEKKRRNLERKFRMIMSFWNCSKPTIAAVHGHCVGGGFELALSCDITLASVSCRMGEPEVRFGSGVLAMLLPWLTGAKAAKELLLSGDDTMTAERALSLGIVNRLVSDDALEEEARSLARTIKQADAHAVAMTKRAINGSLNAMGMQEALLHALEIEVSIETASTPKRTEFQRIYQTEGLKAALAWRDAAG
ncbi:enoyl-CoA hydratase/isomerase family protein [Mesorhizobium sp. CA8]|uniref:enoyl-CoA hydratase/isomerase family protein n=1 Tax=unclassified Mesorhizobium TaxID=325217 RepID=UPI001CCD63F4|nr:MULTISPECIES: enoyl-CoA hydratase/isomerase family protein [unclassified Mesorhizobium]MBZ9761702.1 enoyl-CoA hydratase/isomerase family protein [Mesorhizobium sp. CA8]MBZ9820544.1 enoyl-CoA hydratase/isomerase family protein [Mesorhizobium sp. CA4]